MPSEESTGVAPQTAEATTDVFNLSAIDIAEAAGAPETFIESLTSLDDEASEPLEVEEEEEVVEEEETEEEVEESDEEEEEQEESDEEPKGDSLGIKKRIGKLVKRAELAEAEANRLKSELAGQRDEVPEETQVAGSDRFETINDPKKLDKMEADAEHLREWLITNPEGGEYLDKSGGKYDVDYETAKALHVQTDRDLRKNIPSQRANLHQRATSFQQANQRFPWMTDNGTEEFVEMAGILANNPRAKKFYETDPNAALFFGYAVEGYKSVHADEKKKAKKVGPVEQAPSVPTAPPRQKRATKNTSGAAKQSKLKKQAMQSGNNQDVRSYLESII